MASDEPKIEEVEVLDEEEKRHAEMITKGFPGGINAEDQEEIDAVGDDIIRLRETATGLDTIAVPLGMQRVPESMKENAPANWRNIPVHQIEILPEYGEEHDELVRLRTDLEGMKRLINSLGPICETRLRCQMKLKDADLSAENGANLTQEQVMVLAQDEGAIQKRDIAFETLKKKIDNTKDEVTRTRLTPVIDEVIRRGSADFAAKDQYAEYWSFLKGQSTKIFAEQKKLLERIKVIKRCVQEKLGTANTNTTSQPQVGGLDGFSSRGGGMQNGPPSGLAQGRMVPAS